MKVFPFEIGEKVSLRLWDELFPAEKIGTAEIIGIRRGEYCRSGYLVALKLPDGGQKTLDLNWIQKA